MLHRRRRLSPARVQARWAWAWLWLALVLAPSLGQMHRVLHLPASLGWAAPGGHAHGLAALFAGHSPADCEQLDQLTQGSAPLWLASALLGAAVQGAPGPVPRPAPCAGTARAFDARAPPRA